MDELDEYGGFNTRYEGVGQLNYVGAAVDVYFEARQLFDGRLLIGCVARNPIPPDAVSLEGHLLSGEPFSTIWGRGITEIYRADYPHKVHYSANVTRVRYTKDREPDDHSMQFALHNLIPASDTDVSRNRIDIRIRGTCFTITPVGNYADQSKRLLRHGGNLRTSWATMDLKVDSGDRLSLLEHPRETLQEMLFPISLALGTQVTSPQAITLDSHKNRNDVEHYSSTPAPFSAFICSRGWDSPVSETTAEWFRERQDRLLTLDEIRVLIFQHLAACSTNVFLETRALAAASLLDVLAGRYLRKWNPNVKPQNVSFRDKLERLLADLQIMLTQQQTRDLIAARNSLVHAGQLVTSIGGNEYRAFEQLLLLGRTILLRLVGVPTILHQTVF